MKIKSKGKLYRSQQKINKMNEMLKNKRKYRKKEIKIIPLI